MAAAHAYIVYYVHDLDDAYAFIKISLTRVDSPILDKYENAENQPVLLSISEPAFDPSMVKHGFYITHAQYVAWLAKQTA